MVRKIWLSLIFVPAFAIVGIVVVLKLPVQCCERWRRVRWLPLAGFIYYASLVTFFAIEFGMPWWGVLLLATLVMFGGEWLPPDPCTFILSPRNRRAVMCAIAYVETDTCVLYGQVSIVGTEIGRTIISIAVDSHMIPTDQRFIAVADDGVTISEVDFEYVATMHGVSAWF